MSDNVFNFFDEKNKNEEMCWKCYCGNCSFILYEKGHVECSECGQFCDDDRVLSTFRSILVKSTEEDDDA